MSEMYPLSSHKESYVTSYPFIRPPPCGVRPPGPPPSLPPRFLSYYPPPPCNLLPPRPPAAVPPPIIPPPRPPLNTHQPTVAGGVKRQHDSIETSTRQTNITTIPVQPPLPTYPPPFSVAPQIPTSGRELIGASSSSRLSGQTSSSSSSLSAPPSDYNGSPRKNSMQETCLAPVAPPPSAFHTTSQVPLDNNSANPTTDEPVRTGLAGVKRRRLANELLGLHATTHHLDWCTAWNTQMPDTLITKCQPLYCELCSCSFSSPVQAKMHYEGKTHDRHVRGFFLKEGVHQANLPRKLDAMEGATPPAPQVNCSLCSMEFTSEVSLSQHLLGKTHLRMSSGQTQTKPSVFNKQTKHWEKTPVLSEVLAPVKPADPSMTFFCEVCKVGAPSQNQLDIHLNGKSHKKRMQKGLGGVSNDDLDTISKRMRFKESILTKMQNLTSSRGGSNVALGSRPGKDYSRYRTPSGLYYCCDCNVTVNNISLFEQHFGSKKHKQKGAVQKTRR